jgi:hypothetical protein
MDNQNQEPMPASQPGAETREGMTTVILTRQAQLFLDQTRPWVRFVSIMVFIGAALMVLAAVVMIGLTMAGAFAASSGSNPFGAAGMVAVGFFYMMLACLYIAPGVFLSRYATAIRRLKETSASNALEDALKHQKSFWRFVGILMVIGLVITALALIIAILAGVLGVMMAGKR